ncbi:hypothetical protein BKA67DRAFT_586439 [Truncatella angustata]|uniref:Uncharacterized protein n=1 Tax=Truncatella angustata TaxID=152316 RepID=A0A9P8RKM9_9PEZI|nr:uncharacterized protein BKA67DRAFT_586439 [Truncatella angustata]KAH6644906.1 hypothetical protein BKA67DRAFT_586439 [Truncatella angustata]
MPPRPQVYPPICNIPDYDWGADELVDSVIAQLRSRGRSCQASSGPRVCTQLVCEDPGVAVWEKIWPQCNDLDHELQIDCETVADYAQDIKDRCDNSPLTAASDTQGQEFDIEGWSVIVGGHDGCAV